MNLLSTYYDNLLDAARQVHALVEQSQNIEKQFANTNVYVYLVNEEDGSVFTLSLIHILILGHKTIVLWGQEYITDQIGDISYEISPVSFYQVNPVQTEKLYGLALEYADPVSYTHLIPSVLRPRFCQSD